MHIVHKTFMQTKMIIPRAYPESKCLLGAFKYYLIMFRGGGLYQNRETALTEEGRI